jgi:formylglycine-generating enzyme required for sulfatase activity
MDHPIVETAELKVGDVVDGYTLAGLLGMGACGHVFRAEKNGRAWALKVCHPHLDSIPRFQSEIRAVAALPRHPALPLLEDFNRHFASNCWYYVTDLVEGQNLNSFLQVNGPMGESEAAYAFGQLAEGLALVHAAGIVHRDISPVNIIVRASDRSMVLVDFGLATHIADNGSMRMGGTIYQVPAPCQVSGRRADVYDDAWFLGACIHMSIHYGALSSLESFTLPAGGPADQIRLKLEAAYATTRWYVPESKASTGLAMNARVGLNTEGIGGPLLVDLGDGIDLPLVPIPAGDYVMGVPPDEISRDDDEIQHHVTISRAFHMGRYPVTQAQWVRVMGENPSYFKGNDLPVEQVSWNDAVAFCQRLSAITGLEFMLPTEAQWEYSCRAGTATAFHWGTTCNGKQANCRGDLPYGNKMHGVNREKTTPVGMYAPNAWGIYDMHGNVAEWCADWYGAYAPGKITDPSGPAIGQHRVLRGGSWHFDPARCRAGYRNANFPATRGNFNYGFRVVLNHSGQG